MEILEIAKQLGEAIKIDERLLAYDKAKADYEANSELQEKLIRYNVQRTALAEEFNRDPEEQNRDVIEQLKAAMDEIGKEIVAHDEYKAFAAAQKAVTDLMDSINAEISKYAFGVKSECTHDCSTCSSACASRE